MKDDSDNTDLVIIDEDAAGGIARWLPAAVVISAVAGFLALAWYAYHSGTQSIQEDDLLVVEADKTPIKEKPLDPGGMKFPNQDKTIFETFANNTQVPPKVERVLPQPEEPMAKEMNTSETKTWVNEKLHAKPAQEASAATPAPVKETKEAASAPEPVKPVEEKKPETPAAVSSVTNVTDSSGKPVTVQVKEEKPAAAPAKPKVEAPVKVQLGAYGSEKEAREAWGRMQKKFSVLSDKDPVIVKAELPKGTFYRLRVGVADQSVAKALCGKLTAKGQACLPVK